MQEDLLGALQVSPLGKQSQNIVSTIATPRAKLGQTLNIDSPITPGSSKVFVKPNFNVIVHQQKNDQKLINQIVKQYNKSIGKVETRKPHRIAPPLRTKQNNIGASKSPNTKWREEHPQEYVHLIDDEQQLRKKNEDLEVFIIRKMQQEKQEHLLKSVHKRLNITTGESSMRGGTKSPLRSSRSVSSPKPTLEYHSLATRASTSKSQHSNFPILQQKVSESSFEQRPFEEEEQKVSEEVFTVNGKQNEKLDLPISQPAQKLPAVKNIRKYRGNHTARDSRRDSYNIRMDDDLTLDLEMLKDLNKYADKIPWDVQPAIELLQYKRLIMGGSNYTNFRPSTYLPLGLRAYSLKLKLKQHVPQMTTALPEKPSTAFMFSNQEELTEIFPEELQIFPAKATPRIYNAPSPKLVRRGNSKTNPKR